jgi:hypothetical protein
MARYQRPVSPSHSTLAMFTAAVLADRVNGGQYVKADTVQNPEQPLKPLNRSIMLEALSGQIQPTAEDAARAQEIRAHFQGLMMQVVAGKILGEFDAKCLALANGDTVTERDIGYVACLPSIYARAVRRMAQDDRLGNSQPAYLDQVGRKVQFQAEVLKCVYSQNWGCYYVTALTDTNHAVFFSKTQALVVGERLAFQGRVKSHRDAWTTQLSHVKVLGPVAQSA